MTDFKRTKRPYIDEFLLFHLDNFLLIRQSKDTINSTTRITTNIETQIKKKGQPYFTAQNHSCLMQPRLINIHTNQHMETQIKT